jgi:hypothetical protein
MENVPRDRMDDAELMLRVRGQDDEAAFALLVSRHQKSLLNFFARFRRSIRQRGLGAADLPPALPLPAALCGDR